MDIMKADERPTRRAPESAFTGTVWQDPIVETTEPARAKSVRVTFEPGARTNWHTHPLGQSLHVLTGVGIVQKEGEAPHLIRPGDSVWIRPGEKHWHGATKTNAMVHLAIHEHLDGEHVVWLEPVTDEQYEAAHRA
jgi:quercetin dioxygenase-like cupin family protein